MGASNWLQQFSRRSRAANFVQRLRARDNDDRALTGVVRKRHLPYNLVLTSLWQIYKRAHDLRYSGYGQTHKECDVMLGGRGRKYKIECHPGQLSVEQALQDWLQCGR